MSLFDQPGAPVPCTAPAQKTQVIVVDVDGGVADASHRRHFIEEGNWKGFYEHMPADELDTEVAAMLFDRVQQDGVKLVFVTGRPNKYYDATRDWLVANGLAKPGEITLYMRPNSGRYTDHELKLQWLNEIRLQGGEVVLAVDGRLGAKELWEGQQIPWMRGKLGDF